MVCHEPFFVVFKCKHFSVPQIAKPKFIEKINRTAKAFKALGIKEGETVTICMPNAPQGVDSFYALNRIGAVPAMIHPLSAAGEITTVRQYSFSICSMRRLSRR